MNTEKRRLTTLLRQGFAGHGGSTPSFAKASRFALRASQDKSEDKLTLIYANGNGKEESTEYTEKHGRNIQGFHASTPPRIGMSAE